VPSSLHRALGVLACALAIAACGSDSPIGSVEPATSTTSAGTGSASPGRVAGGDDVAIPPAGSPPQTGHPWFLAIGDSVTSGYTVDPARSGKNSTWALGLEQLLAQSGRAWSLYDVACAGETLESYRTHCHDRNVNTAVLQGRSQERTALDAIAAHGADLRLIVVELGSNDLLRVLRSGTPLQSAIDQVRTQLGAVVAELQAAAPGVPVIICNFYNPLENLLPTSESQLAQVNEIVTSVATARGARLADFHAAINTDPAPDPLLCAYVDCAHLDVHPTIAGHLRLAQAVLAALG
jgi:lysophospholipase L1-like esterase